MNSTCKICNSSSGQLMVVLNCCGYYVCKAHLDEYLKNGNSVINCNLCSDPLNITQCLNMKRNKTEIEEFYFKSNNTRLKILIAEIDTIQKDPDFYINEHLEGLMNKLNLKREELKLYIMTQIDDFYMRLLEKIDTIKQVTKENFISEIDLFKKQGYVEIQRLLSDYKKDKKYKKDKFRDKKLFFKRSNLIIKRD